MFFVTLLNNIYWFLGASIGGNFGSFISFDTKGIEFVMTALFIVIFLEQWLNEENQFSSYMGISLSILSLINFNKNNFIIPSMISILTVLTLARKSIEKESISVCQ